MHPYLVLLIYILWFFSVRDVLKPKITAVLFVSLAGLVNIINLYFHYSVGIEEVLEKYPFWPGKNALGLFLVMALCMSGSLPGRIWVLNSLLLIVGTVFSYSRGAWLSAIPVVLGLIIYRFKRLVFIIIACAAIFLIAAPKSLSTRVMDDTNIKERLALWDNTVEIIKKRPVFGSGLGTFTEVYRDTYPGSVPLKGSGSRIIRHAHSLYIQLLVETGITGLTIFLLLVTAGFLYGIRNFIKDRDPVRYGSLLGILAFLVYSITDCTTSWQFIGDSFSHINLIWVLLWVIVLKPRMHTNTH